MNFNNLKLGQKLGLGYGLVLLLSVIVAIVSIIGYVNVLSRVQKSDYMKQIENEMLMARRHEKDFMLRNNDDYVKKHNEVTANIQKIALEAKSLFKLQVDKDEADQIVQQVRKYESSFENYVKIQKNNDELVEKMRAAGHVVTAECAKFHSSQIRDRVFLLELNFLETRKSEKDFIIFKDKQYIEKHNSYFSKVLEQADAINIVTLDNALGDYKKSFEAFYANIEQQNKASEDMVVQARDAIDIATKSSQNQNQKMYAAVNSARLTILILSGLAIILGIIIAVYITRGIINQLGGEPSEVAEVANKVAKGDLTIDFGNRQRIGVMNDIKEMVEKLREIIGNVISGADNISEASQQMSSTSQELSQGANESASSVEEVSSTMEQMTSNIEQNSQNSTQTEKISILALEGMNDVVKRANQAVESNRTIADKIKIINDIAFQTNILALNAAVEAARAGEHGKGFAVVAAEVRKLAERSKVAADEIVTLSVKSLDLTEGAGKRVNEIMPDMERTTKMVQEIAAASAEQSNGASQVNASVQQLNTVTQQNAAASEELSTSAEELASQAEQLKDLVSFFKVEASGIKHSTKKVEQPKKQHQNHVKQQPVLKSTTKKSGGFEIHLKEQDDKNYEHF